MPEEKVLEAKEEKKAEPKHEAISQARLDAEVARRHEAEKKLEALTKSQDESAKKALAEQGKYKELLDLAAPKAAMADEMAKDVAAYFAEETKDLTDDQKALIPEGAAHKQLAWVKKAKAAGIFGTQNNVDKTFNKKPLSGLPPDKWYLELKSDDPKFPALSTQQYREWKAHNGKASNVIRGGF